MKELISLIDTSLIIAKNQLHINAVQELSKGNIEQAKQIFYSTPYNKKDANTLLIKAQIDFGSNNSKQAIKDCYTAIELAKKANDKISLGQAHRILATNIYIKDSEKGREHAELAAKLNQNHFDYLLAAIILLSQKKNEEALIYCENGLKIAPDDPSKLKFYIIKSTIYYKMSNLEAALENATNALKIEPLNPQMLIIKANALIYSSKFKETIICCNLVLATRNSLELEALEIRAAAHIALQSFSSAITDCLRALSIANTQRSATITSLMSRAQYELGNYEEALQYASKSLQIFKSAITYHIRAQAYTKLKKYDEAITDCNSSIELDRNKNIYYSLKAYILLLKGNYKDAIKLSKDTLQLDQNNSQACYVLAKAHLALGDFIQAIDQSKRALLLNTQLEEAYPILTHAYMYRKDYDKVIIIYKDTFNIKLSSEVIKDITEQTSLAYTLRGLELFNNSYYDWSHKKEGISQFLLNGNICITDSVAVRDLILALIINPYNKFAAYCLSTTFKTIELLEKESNNKNIEITENSEHIKIQFDLLQNLQSKPKNFDKTI